MKTSKNHGRTIVRSVIVIALIISVGSIGFVYLNQEENSQPAILGDTHEHADFAVYLNGEKLDFAQDKYMSDSEKALSNFMHLHDMDGEIIHKHISDADVGFFFFTLDMKFNSTCFVTDDGTAYCEDGSNELKMFVNGVEEPLKNEYVFKDIDQILITYGSGETIIKDQIQSVTDRACIQSGLCPERGDPAAEYSCLSEEGCIVEGP